MRVKENINTNTSFKIGNYHYIFYCPGCKGHHGFFVQKEGYSGPTWEFNYNMELPTVSPSINYTIGYGGSKPNHVCHSFIRNGKIQFLSDCTHELADQTIELPEL